MRNYRSLTAVAVMAAMAVFLVGGTAAASVRPRHFQPAQPGAFGTVSAVGGVSTSGTCGGSISDTTGSFTLTAYKSSTVWTVDVSGPGTTDPTTFVAPGVTSPSFANVCVGELVGALGSVDTSTDTVTATKVFVAPVVTPPTPPSPRSLFGTVTAVGGVSTPSTCLTSDTGSFTLSTWRKTTSWAVTVTPTTDYYEPGNPSATLSQVCVGVVVGVQGSIDTSSTSATATNVFITPPPPGVFGSVASVGGVSTSGTCGGSISDTTGSFTLTTYKSSTAWTVDVSGPGTTDPTTFVAPGVTSPSFANVCVGEWVGALGSVDVSAGTVTATTVLVAPVMAPPPPRGVFGTVTAVGGVSAPDTCLTGDAGSFTLGTWKQTTPWAVTVSSSTKYLQPGNPSAGYSNLCVGSVVTVFGTVDSSAATVTASQILFARSMAWSPGGFPMRGRG